MNTAKPTPYDLLPLFPQFLGLHEIGHGGFKTVFKGDVNGRPEVLKVIAIPEPSNTNDPTDTDYRQALRYKEECIARVRREVTILSQCQSPFLVKISSVPLQEHQINGVTYAIYSEEFLDGPDLRKEIKERISLPSELEAKLLMQCLLCAVQEIWSKRVIHRDIKPANIIKLSDENRPFVLIDLGIAFGLLETGLTIPGNIPCTARYLAPEMANADFRANLDYRSDLYTIAISVFEYASGQHPIARDNEDPLVTLMRAVNDRPKKLHDLRPDFSPDFCSLIDQLLKKKPSLRPSNLDDLILRMRSEL